MGLKKTLSSLMMTSLQDGARVEMAHIKIRKGLNIPIKGNPSGDLQTMDDQEIYALDLSPFESTKLSLLKQEGDSVQTGEPVALDKMHPERKFISPATGKIVSVIRGLKRRILSVVIERASEEKFYSSEKLSFFKASSTDLLKSFAEVGLLSHIRQRPCNVLPSCHCPPDEIFIQAIESAPFAPPPHLEVEGKEDLFHIGIMVLSKLIGKNVQLVYRSGSDCPAFYDADHSNHHTAEGPHPIANPSVHIAKISPILRANKRVWTLTVNDAILIGSFAKLGVYYPYRVISVAGEGIPDKKRGYFRVRRGALIENLLSEGRLPSEVRYISGNPLTGKRVNKEDFLGFYDHIFCALPEKSEEREPFHFLRLGRKKYTATRAFLSAFLPKREVSFSTNLHGEERAFVDSEIYQKFLPLKVPIVPIVKALLAEDYEKAEDMGLFEIDSEDFALPSFVCPSKIPMTDIVRRGLIAYATQYLNE